MNIPSPVLRYILVWMTGGIFMFLWPFLLQRQLNVIWPGSLSNSGKVEGLYICIVIVYSLLVAAALVNFPDDHYYYVMAMIPLLILLIGIPTYTVIRVTTVMREKGIATLSPAGSAMLFIVYGISLPVLQKHINCLERHNGN